MASHEERTDADRDRHASETSKHRDRLAPFCEGYGLDVGFGGDPIQPSAIRMDLSEPYAHTGPDQPVQLGGDCRHLSRFRDGSLDYVYSSHVLEDFGEGETEGILREWSRVLRVGGRIVLLLPDQQRYLAYCSRHGLEPNGHHSIEHFSLDYIRGVASRIGNLKVVEDIDPIDAYSFAVVLEKTGSPDQSADELTALRKSNAALRNKVEDLRQKRDTWRARARRVTSHTAVRLARAVRRLVLPWRW